MTFLELCFSRLHVEAKSTNILTLLKEECVNISISENKEYLDLNNLSNLCQVT